MKHTEKYMQIAINEANFAQNRGEIPVGCVIVDTKNNSIVSKSGNMVVENNNPTHHAEILCLNEASNKLNTLYLESCDLYVTLEPCPMCAQAISFFRIRRLYYGAYDPKRGGVDHGAKIFDAKSCFHKPEIYGGIKEKTCSTLLKDFFNSLR